ncbi:MAG: LacI family DNA-binding transcriptional regulator [Elusimicrobiota bacterium]|nr:LacI family DNA-binding transcriptional regulator [Elusimicrobiota bacterium]
MPFTIYDVAARGKVSVATVSRVINNSSKVKAKTRQKVLSIIKKLNYKPNPLARGLIKQKTNNIGLFVPPSPYFFSAYYFREIIRGISEVLMTTQYELIIRQPRHFDTYLGYPSNLSLSSVDGVVLISPTRDDRLVKRLEAFREKPAVIINARSSILNYVDLDNVTAAEKAVEHLINSGCKKIFFINGIDTNLNSQHRLEGYQLALAKNKIPFDPSLVLCADFDQTKAYYLMKEFLSSDSSVDAVFCANDLMAIGAICAIKEKGLRIPEDIQVVGFDDIDLAVYFDPPLTTVRQPLFEMGKKAIELLLVQIENKIEKQEKAIFTGELIIRKSCGNSLKSNNA